MMASSPIPQPPPYFLAGNLPEIDINNGSASLARLAQIYGPIYQLQMLGRRIVVLSSQKYVNEVCDEKRFEKKIGGALEEVRAIAKDGLFTAYPEEKVSQSDRFPWVPTADPTERTGTSRTSFSCLCLARWGFAKCFLK